MIVYFSATGNNKYVAERIAKAVGDRLVSISKCVKAGCYDIALDDGEPLGFITPTYFWTLPAIVTDYMNELALSFSGKHYVYHVLTFGTTTGAAQKDMEKLLRAKGLTLNGRFAVRMVDTWTPIFDISDAEKNRVDTENAEPEIDAVIERVKAKTSGDFNSHKVPPLIAIGARFEYESKRHTRNFSVNDSCVGCGLCEKNCPLQVIQLNEQHRPEWVKEKCAICLGCLHRCPKFAIQYGSKTASHGQFVNPNTKL